MADGPLDKCNRSDEELKQIAQAIAEGRIFSNRHLDSSQDLGLVFTPIALGAFSDYPEKDLEKIGLIYEYLEKAAPRTVNGMPVFYSFRILTKKEFKKVQEYYIEHEGLDPEEVKKIQEHKSDPEKFYEHHKENPDKIGKLDTKEIEVLIDMAIKREDRDFLRKVFKQR